jgi:hypothetical protein
VGDPRPLHDHQRVPSQPAETIDVAVWSLGNPVVGGLIVLLTAVMYTNPRIGFLDRWFAKRLPGNRIGSF